MTLSTPQEKTSSSLVAVAKDPTKLYHFTKTDVIDQINELLQTEASSMLSLAADRRGEWKETRQTSTSYKATTGLQKVLCTISDFFESFSGIAEIVKGADQSYGGLAYGTISLLLSVAVHKQHREEAIEEAMEELTYAFPRLNVLQRLRPGETLCVLVVEVYCLVILFCRDTIGYYARRLRRLKAAVSPKELKMKTLSQLRTKLREIRKESEVMLLEEVDEMRKQLNQIQVTGVDTNSRVRDTQSYMRRTITQADADYLASFRRLLDLRQGRAAPLQALTSPSIKPYSPIIPSSIGGSEKLHVWLPGISYKRKSRFWTGGSVMRRGCCCSVDQT